MQLTKDKKMQIDIAMDYADSIDKSTEWALQYASDCADCDIDDVVNYLAHQGR